MIRLKSEILARLEGVCRHFADVDLDALVERIALLEIKYTHRAQQDPPRFIRSGSTASSTPQ